MSEPKLRFKGFPAYKTLAIENVAPLQRGFDLVAPKIVEGEYPVVFSNGAIRKHNEFKVAGPGVVTGRSGTIGNVHYIEENFWPHNTALWVTNFFGNNPKFIYYLYSNFNLSRFGTGSGVPTLNRNDVHKQLVTIPSDVKEQEKISSFLCAIDLKIENLTKKHELLVQYKKGVMQKIFNQDIRFKDKDGKEFQKWKDVKLGDIAYSTTGSSNRVDSSLIGQFTFFDRSEDIRTSNKYLFDCEAIIVGGEGQAFIPKYFVGKFDLHQRAYAIKDFKNSIGKYIYFHIDYYRNYFLSKAVGSTVKSLRLPMFNEMPIKLPSIDEQEKIASFLTGIDKKLEELTYQLSLTKQYKKGLLQQMFV